MFRIRHGVILIALCIVASGSFLYYERVYQFKKEDVPAPTRLEDVTPGSAIQELPKELNLDAPFYSQAPLGNWDFPWQESCEEASILLAANAYFKHNWTREEFNEEILKMVTWQEKEFGTYLDTTAAQTSTILSKYLGLESIVHENPTFEDIQKILGKGHFMVMFFSGKELGNPNFTNGGPLYHAVLVKGYKENEKVIVHDVGTRNGENYVYDWETLQSAMHDFAVPIESGAKRMLEIIPSVKQ